MTPIPAHMDDPWSEPNLQRPGWHQKNPGVTSLVLQILQIFLGFYVLDLSDWALHWIAKDKMYNKKINIF